MNGLTLRSPAMVARAAPSGVKEVTEVNCTDSTGGAFATAGEGKAFVISSASQRYGLWGFVALETEPDLSGDDVTTYVQVTVGALDDDTVIADLFKTALEGVGFAVVANAAILTVTDAATGTRVGAIDRTSGTFIVTVITQGS